MKKQLTLLFFSLIQGFFISTHAQQPFKGVLSNKEEKLNLVIDLYKESVEVPGMDMFGPMHGYMNGDIYGVWMITFVKLEHEKKATVHLSNDQGSDTQKVVLTCENDSTFLFEQMEGVAIKKVVNRKLVKIPQKIYFIRK